MRGGVDGRHGARRRSGLARPAASGCAAPTLPPLGTRLRRKSAGRTDPAMRTLRPMRAEAGMTARLPTTVMPVLRRSGSATLGVSKSVPMPTTALGPTLTSLSRMAWSTTAPARMTVVEHDDAVAHDGPRVDAHAGREHRVLDGAGDDAAVADEAAVDVGRGADARRRTLLGPGVDDPVTVEEVERRVVVQQLHLGFPVAVDGAHVLPVAVEPVAEDARAGLQHGRDDVAAEVVRPLAQPGVQGLAREDVDAQAGQVAARLARLLLPLGHRVVVVQRSGCRSDGPRRVGTGLTAMVTSARRRRCCWMKGP